MQASLAPPSLPRMRRLRSAPAETAARSNPRDGGDGSGGDDALRTKPEDPTKQASRVSDDPLHATSSECTGADRSSESSYGAGNANEEIVRQVDALFKNAGEDGSAAEEDPAPVVQNPMEGSGEDPSVVDDEKKCVDEISSPLPKDTTAPSETCPKWSDVLCSPSEGGAFSPSREMNKAENLHGVGLTVAVDRAKALSRCGKRCATLLFEAAALYDTFAQSLLKACQSMGPALTSSSSVGGLAAEVNRCVVSFSKQMQGLAICIKGSVARPLHGSSSAMADTVPNIYSRYAVTRVKSFNARQQAIKGRAKYVKSIREAEAAIHDLKQARASEDARLLAEGSPTQSNDNDNGTETLSTNVGQSTTNRTEPKRLVSTPTLPSASSVANTINAKKRAWEDVVQKYGGKHGLSKSCDRVVKALSEVQTLETQYCALVDEENHAVSRSQTMEKMGLEALQKLEEERLHFFLESLGRALQAERGALDNMSLVLTEGSERIDPGTQPTKENPVPSSPSSLFIKRRSSQSEDSSGALEALSLKLPESLGALREKQKVNLARQAARAQAVKSLCSYMEEIASSAQAFASGLQARLSSEGYAQGSSTKSADTLATALNEGEGTRALESWNKVVESLKLSAKSAFDLSKSVRESRHCHLDKYLLPAEKNLKASNENEESRWKNLCDAARAEIKAKSRYEQCAADLGKARERFSTVEDSDEVVQESASPAATSMSKKMNRDLNKALGNMFSILPGGGEEAMAKMLKKDTRRAIAMTSLEEAIAKESKDKHAFLTAKAAKEKAVAAYSSAAKAFDATFSSDDGIVWAAVKSTLEEVAASFQAFQSSRYESVEPAATLVRSYSGSTVIGDVAEWTVGIQEKLATHLERSEQDSRAGAITGKIKIKRRNQTEEDKSDRGFKLQAILEDTKNVHKLLALVTSEDDDAFARDAASADVNDDADMAKSKTADSSDSKNRNSPPGPASPDLPAKEASENGTDKSHHNVASLPRSQSAPATSLPSTGRQPSSHTKELMTLAETLKSTAERDSPGATGGSISLSTPKVKRNEGEYPQASKTNNAETEVFLAHFWDQGGSSNDNETPPSVIESFSCAYWPKEDEGYISPLLHGRLFATSPALYFVGWGDRKIVLSWGDVMSITKETTMMGTVDNALRVTYDSGEGMSSYFFGSFAFRENAFQIMTRLSTVAKSLNEITDKSIEGAKSLPSVPPDGVLKRMEPVLSKKLKNVTIQRFYERCWSEGNRTEADPFYGPWLEKKGSHDVSVSEWEFADEGSDEFENSWCGEKYKQKRTVHFKFTRTTHLYVGPPVAGVTQTQHCRIEGDDKCVLAMTVEMDGIPYADCFAVEVRWVARRLGLKDLSVDVGVFVDFRKSTMLKSKIRSGTLTETKPIHQALFESIKEACASGGEAGEEEEIEEEESVVEVKEEGGVVWNQIREFMRRINEGPVRALIEYCRNMIAQNSHERFVTGSAALLVFCLVAFYFVGRPSNHHVVDEHNVYEETLELLSGRIDHLSDEVREIRHVLDKIVVLLEDSNDRRSDEL